MGQFQEGEEVARPFMEHLLMLSILEEKLHLHDMEVAFGVIARGKEVSLSVALNSNTTIPEFKTDFIRIITKMAASAPAPAPAPAPVLAAADVVASPPVASSEEGVFNELRREIQNVVCKPAQQSTQPASEEASSVIIKGAEALEALEPRMDEPQEDNTAAAGIVSQVNVVMKEMINGLEKTGPGVGGIVLAAAILDEAQAAGYEEPVEMAVDEPEKHAASEPSVSTPVQGPYLGVSSIDNPGAHVMEESNEPQANPIDFAVLAQPSDNPPTVSLDRLSHDRDERSGLDPLQSEGDVQIKSGRDRSPDHGGGGKSRRKSRKNVKKTTRRNKKIVRKSSKNTKQQRGRSSRRHRSSRKSRK